MKKQFFICGSQRSGTTMMRLILDSHPQVHCFGELTAYKIFEESIPEEKWDDLSNKKFDVAGFQTPIWTELFIEYDSIADICDEKPIVFMIRNPLDCVGSMTKVGYGRMDWIVINVLRPMKIWSTDENRTLFSDFGEELEPLFEAFDACEERIKILTRQIKRRRPNRVNLACNKELIVLCGIYWKYKNIAFKRMLESKYRVLGVDYDDCVKNPKEEIKRITDFLEIPWDDQLLLHHKLPHTESKDGWVLGNTRVDRPIDLESLNRRKELDEEEIRLLNESTGEFYKQLKSLIHQ